MENYYIIIENNNKHIIAAFKYEYDLIKYLKQDIQSSNLYFKILHQNKIYEVKEFLMELKEK